MTLKDENGLVVYAYRLMRMRWKVIAALYGVSQWEKCSDSGDGFFERHQLVGPVKTTNARAEFWSQSGYFMLTGQLFVKYLFYWKNNFQ